MLDENKTELPGRAVRMKKLYREISCAIIGAKAIDKTQSRPLTKNGTTRPSGWNGSQTVNILYMILI